MGSARRPSKFPLLHLLQRIVLTMVYSQLEAILTQHHNLERAEAPIKMERYDNISAWNIFQVPRVRETVGADHATQMNVILPVSCVGPLDDIVILVNIGPNPDWPRKASGVRVNRIQVSLSSLYNF
jgi:hypothetical protein